MDEPVSEDDVMRHEDGSPVTLADMEASLLRQNMLDFLEAVGEWRTYIREFEDACKRELADRSTRIMTMKEADSYTWKEWVNDRLYPEE